MRPVRLPVQKDADHDEAHDEQRQHLGRGPTVVWSQRDGGREEAGAEEREGGAQRVELAEEIAQLSTGGRRSLGGTVHAAAACLVVKGFDARHDPKGNHGEHAPDDGDHEEDGPPVEHLGRHAAQDAAQRKTDGVSGAKCREGNVLALGRPGVRRAEDADGGGNHHGGADAQEAAEYVHPEGVLGEARDDGKEGEGGQAADEHEAAAQEVGELSEGQLEGAGGERGRGGDPGDLALRHAEVVADLGRHGGDGADQKRPRHDRRRRHEDEEDFVHRGLEDGRTLPQPAAFPERGDGIVLGPLFDG